MTENAYDQTARTWLWHTFPDGTFAKIEVAIPLDYGATPDVVAQCLANNLNAYHAAGFTANAPDAEEGERIQEASQAVFVNFTNRKDNTKSIRVFFYPANDKMKMQCGNCYLDTPEEIATFERVTGITVANTKRWPAQSAPDRGADDTEGYFYDFKRPVRFAQIPNPKYKPEGKDALERGAKYVFERFMDNSAPKAPATSAVGNRQTEPSGSSEPELTVVSHDPPAQPKSKGVNASVDWKKVYEFADDRYGNHPHAVNVVKKLSAEGKIDGTLNTVAIIAEIQKYYDLTHPADVEQVEDIAFD